MPENNKVISRTEGGLTLHWDVAGVAGSKIHGVTKNRPKAAYFRNSMSSYTPQSQKCMYQLNYNAAPQASTPMLYVTFERLKEGV